MKLSILCILAVVFGQHEPSPEDQQCLNSAFRAHYKIVVANFATADYGAASFASRQFYDLLWKRKLTSEQLKTFCRAHRKGVRQYDKCNNTMSKDVRVLSFGLTDYICKKRLETYATNLPCMQNVYESAKSVCNNQCQGFDSGSRREGQMNQSVGGAKAAKAAECQYLNCTAICHRPIFERRCGALAANLELEALYAMEAAERDAALPPDLAKLAKSIKAIGRGDFSIPMECAQLADSMPNWPINASLIEEDQDEMTTKSSIDQTLSLQPTPQDEQCIGRAFQVHYTSMAESGSPANYVMDSFQFRRFYDRLWKQPITSEQLGNFCRGYVKGVSAYNVCRNSIVKETTLASFGLLNYVCKKKADEYKSNLPCLQNAYEDAATACKDKCSEFESGSSLFRSPPENATAEERNLAMRADCQYLNCTAECQRPTFERKCNAAASRLQLEALYVMEASRRDTTIPRASRGQLALLETLQGNANPFPAKCGQLADNALTLR